MQNDTSINERRAAQFKLLLEQNNNHGFVK